MSGTVWTKFFWSDWESDPGLRACSLAAQGLWMRLLCIAAGHDPIGYVAVAGRALEETELARMTGVEESQLRDLLGELDRNGVFSRDRTGRIYSRRLTADARKAATARRNGLKGGNPSLCAARGNPAPDKGRGRAPVKPQSPEARPSVGRMNLPNRRCGEDAAAPADGAPATPPWSGPGDVRAAAVAAEGEDFVRAYLDGAGWDADRRAILARTGVAADRLRRALRPLLAAHGLTVTHERSA